MDNVVLTITLAILASTGFWTLLSTIINKRTQHKSAYNKMTLALVRDKLLYLCEKYIERGWLSPTEHEILNELYQAYIAGGGNGTIKHLYDDRIKNLDIKEK